MGEQARKTGVLWTSPTWVTEEAEVQAVMVAISLLRLSLLTSFNTTLN